MFARTYGATTLGVDGLIIDVEVDSAAGLPGFNIVGLPDTSVKESRERVRTAIRNSGIRLRQENVTINLAPAAIRKDGSGLDLPIAVGLLAAYGAVPPSLLDKSLFVAELSLEGECRGVHGILPMVMQARQRGLSDIFVAKENANEALLVDGIHVYALDNLLQLVQFLNGGEAMEPAREEPIAAEPETIVDDFADVQGQYQAKRALEIAAAGGHNVLMVGVPGAGKTMLARRVSTILPKLSKDEALEVTKIYSIAGLLPRNSGLMTKRPFRSPHHTASMTAMVGGGSVPRPGEVTLAHHGVLFLDELPEFSKKTLEVLREPIEDQQITVARIHATITYPASFILITSLNPCPCGFLGDPDHDCSCTPAEIKRYMRRISGPLLDRIDIHIRVARVKYEELSSKQKAESSAVIRQRVEKARELQRKRLKPYGLFCNAQMSHAIIRKECPLPPEAQKLLEQAFSRLMLSARSYDRIIKVARTIADLAGAQEISAVHIAEAIQLRNDIGLAVD
ncbi:YifB family Mg chelatase-like AAA ATPase [Selenomonas ruminis]|uniref:YifB family Mg chelatase-like AAA ATPase n=1 Tax=Selenomonas ruminis TaxID=2593411 RepID=A0A5D6W8B3_9FIRM|nr:YifB family Mg chelatase-like AAA ATPase [Selenomonas sp. mPRGC5]TYZ22964.1 YifB family Mg chelatase-like AAA ATPase [Selenomonas sp. mPRGC5]